ncbi:MAG: hemolysin family protein [Planctomycetota bacterium]
MLLIILSQAPLPESAAAHSRMSWELGVPLAVFLLILNGFFVAAEFALVAVRRSRIEELANKGSRTARMLRGVLSDLDRYIAGVQVGITLASIGLGIVGEPILAAAFMKLFEALPGTLGTVISHTVASAISFLVITLITVVVSETVPKSVALRFPERIAFWLVRPIRFVMFILSPFVSLVDGTSNLLLKLLRIPHAKLETITPDELRYVVEQAEQSGAMGEHAADVVQRALRFPNTVVRQVMVHRRDVESINIELPTREIYKAAARGRHSRIPVYRGELDRIVGMLHVKELLKHDPATLDVTTILRQPLWVTADTPIPDLVAALRKKRTRTALVTDEFGAFFGLVTLEDAAEVVIGEVLDEHEQPRQPIPTEADGRYLVNGNTRLLDLQNALDHEFAERAVTVGGFLMRFLGKLPDPGEKIVIEGFEFEVESVSGTQIGKIRCRVFKEERGDETPADGEN